MGEQTLTKHILEGHLKEFQFDGDSNHIDLKAVIFQPLFEMEIQTFRFSLLLLDLLFLTINHSHNLAYYQP